MSQDCGDDKLCKVAFIGAGYMMREHARAFRDVRGVRLVGVVGRTRERADAVASEFAIPLVCDTIEMLYAKTNADLVVVCVPELEVNSVACQAFLYGWTVLLEKPAGYNLSDAESILAASERNGVKAYVALNRRHYGSTRNVLQALNESQGPRLISVIDQEDPASALAGGRPKEVVDNWVYANSIHIIDYLRIFGRGQVASVDRTIHWNSEAPLFAAAKISFDSGDVGLYQAIWNAPGPWAVTVNTRANRWELKPLEKAVVQMAGQRTQQPLCDDPWDTEYKPGLRQQAEQAVLAARGQPSNLPTLADALETMRLGKAIYGLVQ